MDEESNELEECSQEHIEEFFDYIDNGEEDKIKENLPNKKIWEFYSQENDNSTVLHLSVFKKLFNLSELFVEYCKKYNKEGLYQFINKENDQGITALHYASFRGNVKIIRLLIENGANIYIRTKRLLNVIHYSAQGNRPSSLMFFYLIFKEKNDYSLITEVDSGGSTPLHWAAYSNAEDALLYLINLDFFKTEEEKRNFMNIQDYQGFTPLHLSVNSKSKRIVMKLLQNGASSDIKDKKGKTPLDLAINKKENEIVEIIKNNQSWQICAIKAPVKQIKKSTKNIRLVFFFQIITTAILFSGIISAAFSTGRYEENISYNIIFLIYITLLIFFFVLYFQLLFQDPGVIRSQPIEILPKLLQSDEDLSKYCYKCYVKKSKHSKHCIICNQCYENFDHHCYWINKCVAGNNYMIFLIFLLETCFYLSIVLFISILGLIHLIHNHNIHPGNKFYFNFFAFHCVISNLITKKKFLFALDVTLLLVDLSFLIPETLLLILHLHVCISNYNLYKKNSLKAKASNINTLETSLITDTNSETMY